MQPVAALATDWQQVDPLTWQFRLQEGVQWHKGYGEVTADDVAFTANYAIEEKKPSAFLYSFVEGAKAIDKYTVEYKMERPFTPFLVTTAVDQATWMVCKKAYEEIGEDEFARNPVGAGPFEFVSWEAGAGITLKRFDKYFKSPLPQLDQIVIRPVLDSNIKKLQLLNGELDFIGQPDWKDIAELQQAPGITVAMTDGWTWNAIVFNMKLPADHPVMKKEVRQAIAYAIDREAIVAAAYGQGNAVPDDQALPAGYLAADPGVHQYGTKANLEKARELMAQAGLADGFTVKGLVDEKLPMRKQLEVIASQLSEIGITVEMEQIVGGLTSRFRAGEFEMGMLDINIMTPDPDSALYWFQHTNTSLNLGYDNPRVDELLDNARSDQDQEARKAMYEEVLRNVLDDAPYIYTCHRNMAWAYNRNLTGFLTPKWQGMINLAPVHWTA